MKTLFKLFATLLLGSLFSGSAFSSIIIDGTRIIYPGDRREVNVHLSSKGELPALIQSWIDDGDNRATPETSTAPFIVSPPVSPIEPKSGQALRISLTSAVLPKNRESLFWFNVVEIPPEHCQC